MINGHAAIDGDDYTYDIQKKMIPQAATRGRSEDAQLRQELAQTRLERDAAWALLAAVPRKEIAVMDDWVGDEIDYMPAAWGAVRAWLRTITGWQS